jgi:hypothetical protein
LLKQLLLVSKVNANRCTFIAKMASNALSNICNTPHKMHKTPAKTPKAPKTPGADRFIPTRRGMDFNVCKITSVSLHALKWLCLLLCFSHILAAAIAFEKPFIVDS